MTQPEDAVYTVEQFMRATAELRPIVEGLSGIDMPAEGWQPFWGEGFCGSEPEFCALLDRKNPAGHMSLEVYLQDDGFAPYAVVDICRFFPAPASEKWHAASPVMNVHSLYPHQVTCIPGVVAWLRAIPPLDLPPGLFDGVQPVVAEEHDLAFVLADQLDLGLQEGDRGTIVHVYPGGVAFAIEFPTTEGLPRVIDVEAALVRFEKVARPEVSSPFPR